MKVSEVTDPDIKEYIEYLKKHPKFSPEGTVDEDCFYTQPDGSNDSISIRFL